MRRSVLVELGSASDERSGASPGVLPPGQVWAPLLRFGLPEFAARRPEVPAHPVLAVSGAVRRPVQVDIAELMALPARRAQISDFHCVTTWSSQGLRWEGVPFRAVHELLAERAGWDPAAGWVTITGLDGYRSCLLLEDALAEDVLLADMLNDMPLSSDHGAPLRLVAPAQYTYKSVKHVCALEYRHDYDAGSAGYKGHPRGRVAGEERSRGLPGKVWRQLWRLAVPVNRRIYRKYESSI